MDLGEWWFERTGGLPLPLGGNIIRRDLGPEIMKTVSKMLRQSAYALKHREAGVEYARQFGRGLDRKDTDTVGMAVNDLTLDYGTRGRAALRTLLHRGLRQGSDPAASAGRVRLRLALRLTAYARG